MTRDRKQDDIETKFLIVRRHLQVCPDASWPRSMTFALPAPSRIGPEFTGATVKTAYARRSGAGDQTIARIHFLRARSSNSEGRTSGYGRSPESSCDLLG